VPPLFSVAPLRPRLPGFTLKDYVYFAAAILFSAPAWIVKYPPMMDLPFHLATIRVIHDYSSWGFDQDYLLTLGRTQYVFYYLVGSLLAYFVGVVAANVVLMSGYFAGTFLGMRALLRALGRDERLSFFVVPILVNAMFMFGLFPFLIGIPLMLWALAVSVRWFEKGERNTGILLAILAMALFYSHVFPFAVFGLGFAAMFPWKEPERWLRAGLPTVPALLTLGWWTLFTEAGKLTRGALTDSAQDVKKPVNAAIADVCNWLTDVFQDTTDDVLFVLFIVLVVAALGLSLGDRDRAHKLSRMYVLLPIACIYFYFNSTEGHGYIWLIAQRFPILFLITLIPILRMPTGWRGHLVASLGIALAAASTINTCRHFIEFQLDEVGDFDGALANMDERKKVCALIFDKGSRKVVKNQWSPFLHFGSYYQAKKGGVIEFTYAGYAHWPLDFKPGRYPPPGGPARLRWEWTPELVTIGEIYPYYDYVLTRGEGFHPPAGTYRPKWRSSPWTVWERLGR
jgi:hypothetical protein